MTNIKQVCFGNVCCDVLVDEETGAETTLSCSVITVENKSLLSFTF